MEQYIALFDDLKISFDVAILTETWLNNNNSDQCEIYGYQKIKSQYIYVDLLIILSLNQKGEEFPFSLKPIFNINTELI